MEIICGFHNMLESSNFGGNLACFSDFGRKRDNYAWCGFLLSQCLDIEEKFFNKKLILY